MSKQAKTLTPQKLRKELTAYIAATPSLKSKHKLFYSQKVGSDGFSANTQAYIDVNDDQKRKAVALV
jgi:hypothetical protein